jgi:hypothetical protein
VAILLFAAAPEIHAQEPDETPPRAFDELMGVATLFGDELARGRMSRISREGVTTRAESTELFNRLLGLDESPVRIHGWIQNSFTGNPAGPANGLNFGVNPNSLADQWMGNQYYLIVENPIAEGDEVDFGFRIDNLFGNDWQFNHMAGLFNDAFRLNHFAGYDPAQFYAEVHLPILTEGGVNVKGGRWYSITGYEGVAATARPLLSVPYMFNYGQPFTHWGVLSTLHHSDSVDVFGGSVNGWDRFVDFRYVWGYIGGFQWDSADERAHLGVTAVWGPNQFPNFLATDTQLFPIGYVNVPSLAGKPNPGYARNDRVLFTTVMSYKWTEEFTQVFEANQGWERSIPGLGSGGKNGLPASDQWYGIANWFLYDVDPKLTLVLRGEWFRNVAGSRTGYRGDFQEVTAGAIIKPAPKFWIRPEIRFDWANPSTPYNDGTSGQQLTIGVDAIWLY